VLREWPLRLIAAASRRLGTSLDWRRARGSAAIDGSPPHAIRRLKGAKFHENRHGRD
jgi:hypothetical protein